MSRRMNKMGRVAVLMAEGYEEGVKTSAFSFVEGD